VTTMKPTDTFVRIAWKLWPAKHRRFEEMCALAATSQLGSAQMYELDAHVARCPSCLSVLESMAQVSAQVMPLLAENRIPALDCAPPEGMRERFFSRLGRERLAGGAIAVRRPYSPPVREAIAPALEKRQRFRRLKVDGQAEYKARLRPPSRISWAAGAVAACAVASLIGFHAGERGAVQPMASLPAAKPLAAPPDLAAALDREANRIRLLEGQMSSLEDELGKVRAQARQAEIEKRSLGTELTDTQVQLAALTAQAREASQRSASDLQAANSQIAMLESRVSTLNQRLAGSEMGAFSQQQTARQLQAKLEAAQAELHRDRNRQDLKSSMIRLGELAAAPNLHIVDVYDADASGARKQSFGRVFYVEGKSLVFYAYDLNDRGHFKANVMFHVWGGKTGAREVTHSLGILRQDTGGESRWTMTFDDPTVLAQINSVFVTAEAARNHYDRPHGRKILFAFLDGQPNHP